MAPITVRPTHADLSVANAISAYTGPRTERGQRPFVTIPPPVTIMRPESQETAMGTKTTFVCDCCLREADHNLGWAHVSVNGASDGKQLMPDENRDLCEVCWSPLQTLMKKGP
jgi:hypothetical protein